MVTIWYPNNKGMGNAKIYLKQLREIPILTKWRIFITPAGKDGLKPYYLTYAERGKAEVAGNEIFKYFTPFGF